MGLCMRATQMFHVMARVARVCDASRVAVSDAPVLVV